MIQGAWCNIFITTTPNISPLTVLFVPHNLHPHRFHNQGVHKSWFPVHQFHPWSKQQRKKAFKRIYRGYYMVALVRKILFCHSKIKFISSSRHVMFFLLYRQKDIHNIIDFYLPKRKTPRNFEGKLPKLRHRKTHVWDYGK